MEKEKEVKLRECPDCKCARAYLKDGNWYCEKCYRKYIKDDRE